MRNWAVEIDVRMVREMSCQSLQGEDMHEQRVPETSSAGIESDG